MGTHAVKALDDVHADARHDLDVALLALALVAASRSCSRPGALLERAPAGRGAVERGKLEVVRERASAAGRVNAHGWARGGRRGRARLDEARSSRDEERRE